MPVLPEVASTIVVRPGSIRPSRSAACTMATPIRSLTEPPGLYISSLANRVAPASGARRLSCTIGVRPMCSAMLIGIDPIVRRQPTGDGGSSGPALADERAEARLCGLLACLALDRDGLRGAD